MIEQHLKSIIRDIPDFPKEGIIFKDITPLLSSVDISEKVLDDLYGKYKNSGIEAIAGIESRGFLFGMPLAIKLGVPFIPIRKEGKLPHTTIGCSYDLEYGQATIEMHVDAVKGGMKVLIHDDLLATGGTAKATAQLIENGGAEVAGFSFIVNLKFLDGQKVLTDHSNNIDYLVTYE